MDHLLLVPCHSIWIDKGFKGVNAEEWILADFQKDGMDHLCFIDHIHKACEALSASEGSIIIISGGQTKTQAEGLSEAKSYFNLAKQTVAGFDELVDRVFLEEYARDSFENVLFLLCKFKELTGAYPKKISIFGFEFKRYRFTKLHLERALGFPVGSISYYGNSPMPQSLDEQSIKEYFAALERDENRYAVQPFSKDWYGIHQELADKRKKRNPFNQENQYHVSNSSLRPLLDVLRGSCHAGSNEEIKMSVDFPWQ